MPLPDARREADDPRRVAEQFAGPVITSLRPFGAGHINDTWLAETPGGAYVVQRVNTAVFTDPAAVTANILTVYRHVAGELLPEPVPTVDDEGQWMVSDGSGTWRAWRRVPGEPRPAADAGPAALGAAGRLLGRFHALLDDLDPGAVAETLPGFHDPGRRLAALRAAVAADPCERVATVREEIAMAETGAPLAELAAALTGRVPQRVAHFDAKLDNVLFDGDDAVRLVDLDTLMPGAWFWDVGDLLRSGATTAAEDEPDPTRVSVAPERYEAILDGYRQGRADGGAPLDAAEREAVEAAGAIITYEQAVRFLTDWIAGDVYYRVHRPDQNLDRARTQFALLASMPR